MSFLSRATLTVVLVSAASASGLAAIDEAGECAEFITSQIDDEPLAGELCGTRTIETYVSGILHPHRTSYEVHGLYRMSDGEIVELDCDTYERAD